jgi:hypothetical protein
VTRRCKGCPPAGFDARGVNFERCPNLSNAATASLPRPRRRPKSRAPHQERAGRDTLAAGAYGASGTRRACASALAWMRLRAGMGRGEENRGTRAAPAPGARPRACQAPPQRAHTHKHHVPGRGCCGRSSPGKRRNANKENRQHQSFFLQKMPSKVSIL